MVKLIKESRYDYSRDPFKKTGVKHTGYWYVTNHGLGPGMIPRGVDVLDNVNDGGKTYVELDTALRREDEIKYELTKEKPPVSIKEEIESDTDEELETAEQEFTSAKTSINSNKLPAIFRMVSFKPGTINLDFGGGKFDNASEFLKTQDVINLIYDPYNRSSSHNNEVIKTIRKNGGADTATISNVLNVIKEENARLTVLRNVKRLLKSGGTCYITVYEGTGRGDSKETKSGYQLNKKTADYIEEIESVFNNVTRKGKLIIAK